MSLKTIGPLSLEAWEKLFQRRVEEEIKRQESYKDPGHDLSHFQRVVKTAKFLAQKEGASLEVVIPAAWLHDIVNVPKNDPKRAQASKLSAEAALEFLSSVSYPDLYFEAVAHAIEAHSFSAKIEAKTLEAKVVQDADRLDGVGAIGIARCFVVGGLLGARIYHPKDPFALDREQNDRENMVDHFYVKLFETVKTLQTPAGRAEGIRRAEFMKTYLRQLAHEIGAELH